MSDDGQKAPTGAWPTERVLQVAVVRHTGREQSTHFSDEEMKAQRYEGTSPGPSAREELN